MDDYHDYDASASPDESPDADCTDHEADGVHAPRCGNCRFIRVRNDNTDAERTVCVWQAIAAADKAQNRKRRWPGKPARWDDEDDDPVIPDVGRDDEECEKYQADPLEISSDCFYARWREFAKDLLGEGSKLRPGVTMEAVRAASSEFKERRCPTCDGITAKAERREQRRARRQEQRTNTRAEFEVIDGTVTRPAGSTTPKTIRKPEAGDAITTAYAYAAQEAGRPDVPESAVRDAFKARHQVRNPDNATRERQDAWSWARKRIPPGLETFEIGGVKYIRERPK
jgi:hypothetical protein